MGKKIGRGILYFILLCALLRACGALTGHEHTWTDATCTEPQTCSSCGKTDGEPKGHTWEGGTCIEPAVCAVCGESGSKGEHTWAEATCTEPEHCSVCGRDRHWYSLPLGHEWIDATCTAPKTCAVCGETEGDPQHVFVSYRWETTIEPTCQAEGQAENTCTLCGAVETKALPTVGHKADGWTILQEATAGAPGVRVKICAMCGMELERDEYEYTTADSNTGGSGGGNNFNTYNNTDQQNTTDRYVLNTRSRVFHLPSCRDVPRISPSNYSTTNRDRDDLTASGWRACGHCSP